jgi:hypothetical protein
MLYLSDWPRLAASFGSCATGLERALGVRHAIIHTHVCTIVCIGY